MQCLSLKNMLTKERSKQLSDFIKKNKLSFSKLSLLNQALTHKSYSHENKLKYNNETLEYLGDSVIDLVVNEYLYRKYTKFSESQFSRIKSYVVSRVNLYKISKEINLDDLILLGKGELKSGGKNKTSNIGNAFEALIGALYLNKGLKVVSKFLLRFLEKEIQMIVNKQIDFDYKSQLQEMAQKKFKVPPMYKLIAESGPDHKKEFEIAVYVNGELLGKGKGSKKIIAEDHAAKNALKKIK